jgi:hypothetical protein
MRFALRNPTPTLAETYAALEASRAAAADFLVCPITREPLRPEEAVLASDGHLYDPEALQAWLRRRARDLLPALSPVTRQVLRPWLLPAAPWLEEAGLGAAQAWTTDHAGGRTPSLSELGQSGGRRRPAGSASFQEPATAAAAAAATVLPLSLPASAPPFPPLVETRTGTQRASRWTTPLGVACRMLLRWDEGDVVEWCFPATADGRTILTPPPARELLPMARPVLAWLGLGADELTNPEHILTAWFRIHRPSLAGEEEEEEDGGAPSAAKDLEEESRERSREARWATLELFLLRLNRPRRARGL